MLVFKCLLIVALSTCPVHSLKKFWTNYTINAVKYFQMPELNKFDGYDACMDVFQDEAIYCYVKSALKPDPTSELYNFIEQFSSKKKQHFRHDKLTRGICINNCQKLINEMGRRGDNYYTPKFDFDYTINFDFIGYANSSEDRDKFNQIVNQCINADLERYNLSSYSSIEYCVRQERGTKVDALDIFFIVALTTLLFIVYVSSSHDEKLRRIQLKTAKVILQPDEYYKQTPGTKTQKFMLSFSFIRNWHLLSAPTKSDMRDLRALSAVRIWTMIAIIYGHCSWFTVAMPISNPQYIEQSYHKLFSMIVINGGNLVQSFFFIGGFVNSIVFLAYIDREKVKNFMVLVKALIYRCVRFTPVLLFLVLLHSTWLYRFNSGPYWDKFNFYERQACRQNMWTNFLFINNYISGDMKCMVHTWFLSADLHLSCLGTGLLLLVVNFPKRQNLFLFGSIFISLLISFIHFYLLELEPILILSPETLRNQLITTSPYDRYFFDFHAPTHFNTGNYFIGLVIGYFYYQFKKGGQRHRRKAVLEIVWHLSYISTFILCFIGVYFYEHDIEKGIWSALLGTILKHIYAPILAILIIGIFFRYGGLIPKMFNYGLYRILGRLSFSVYMVHVTIGSVMITGQKYPLEVNHPILCSYTLGVYGFSHLAALMLALCIELPAHVIYKTIMDEIVNKPKQIKARFEGKSNQAFEGQHELAGKDDITKC